MTFYASFTLVQFLGKFENDQYFFVEKCTFYILSLKIQYPFWVVCLRNLCSNTSLPRKKNRLQVWFADLRVKRICRITCRWNTFFLSKELLQIYCKQATHYIIFLFLLLYILPHFAANIHLLIPRLLQPSIKIVYVYYR